MDSALRIADPMASVAVSPKGVSVRTKTKRSNRGLPGWGNALLLIVSLLLPFVQPAFSSTTDAATLLPACCRTHGKHKCLTRISHDEHSSSQKSPELAQLTEKCPCPPGLAPSTQNNLLWLQTPELSEDQFSDRQTPPPALDAERTLSRPRANPKRGPPASA
jgi:hypothetical protein